LLLETINMGLQSYPDARNFLADYEPGSGDCLVVDCDTPGMSGIELFQHLKTRDHLPPSIIIIAHEGRTLKQ
jgi:two-component system response regulator TtrR